MSTLASIPTKPRRIDRRLLAVGGIIAGIAMLGTLIQQMPSRGVEAENPAPATPVTPAGFADLKEATLRAREEIEVLPEPANPAPTARARASQLIKQAGQLTRDKKPEDAIRLLNAEQALLKDDPRAYYHLAKALMGRGDAATARDFYQKAIDLNPAMADAYFGFAEASEAAGDLVAALGGMRSFIHLSKDADPYRLRIAQARSAIWEWEAKLGRGPWGPTQGVPPGFTADEIKRDGRGVGIKMQKIETLRPDGTMDAEMKAQSKIKIFRKE